MLLRDELGRHGVAIEPQPLFTQQEDLAFRSASSATRLRIALRSRRRTLRQLSELRPAPEIALVQRQAGMLPDLSLERAALRPGRLVWDLDDAIWLDASREARLHPTAFLKATGRKVRWLQERADQIIVGNETLAEHFSTLAEKVAVVPSLVDPRRLPQRDHADRDEIILGWIGSYPNVRYLEERLPELSRAAAASGRRVRLIAVGAAGLPEAEGLSVEASEWTAERELDALSRIDIGLMPLPDNPWTRGKCAYKGILYMAAGIPVVADDVGLSAEAIGDRKGGLIVRDPTEWSEAVEALIGDAALRGRLGAEARGRADEQFSVTRWAPTLASLIRG